MKEIESKPIIPDKPMTMADEIIAEAIDFERSTGMTYGQWLTKEGL